MSRNPDFHTEEKEKWIEDYVYRETAVAGKRVQHPQTAVQKELDDMSNAEKVGLTTRKPETKLRRYCTLSDTV